MAEIQRANPTARRQAALLVAGGALSGALLIVVFERYRTPLRDWLVSEPEQMAHRLRLFFLLSAVFVSAPLFGLAAYLWSLSGKVMRTGQFPPPGQRLVRDTPILRGQAARWRGRSLRVLAICVGGAGAILWLLLGWLASALVARAV
jgi:hypothetical protein